MVQSVSNPRHYTRESSTLIPGPTDPLSNGHGTLFPPEVKQPDCEADHSPPSSAEAKYAWSSTATPPVHLHGMVLN